MHTPMLPPALYPSRAQRALTRRHDSRRSAAAAMARRRPLPAGHGVLRTMAVGIAALAFLLAMAMAPHAHGAEHAGTRRRGVHPDRGAGDLTHRRDPHRGAQCVRSAHQKVTTSYSARRPRRSH